MTQGRIGRLFFDPGDYELVSLVNEFVARGRRSTELKKLFNPYLHPRGIKELAASQQQRIAYCVMYLLDTLEGDQAEDRIVALRSLRDEVLNNSSASLRRNTARVLIEIMKQLVREHGNQRKQLELAHDFFACSSGRPTVIRRELRNYHLLEMPESWNQVAFDHHVHDAHTKGRKSPTHLITDAWIKGIQELTVVYYNYVGADVVSELTEAAEIMGVKVRIGIELAARFRQRYVHFIWAPRGFSDRQDFVDFLALGPVMAFVAAGREVSQYNQQHVFDLLQNFNLHHLADFNRTYGTNMASLDPEQFRKMVGPGQASVAHLAEFIHNQALPEMAVRVEDLRKQYYSSDADGRKHMAQIVDQLNQLMPETIAKCYLSVEANPQLPDPKKPASTPDVPELLRLKPRELINSLRALPAGFRLTLNPSNLTPADVLEVLYDAAGMVTHLEIFNLKDYRQGRNPHASQIAAIRRVINSGSPIALKHVIQEIIRDVTAGNEPDKADRLEKLHHMLRDIPRFLNCYRITRLQSRLGSDSIGRGAGTFFGMGLVVKNTLHARARKELKRDKSGRETIPIRTDTSLQAIYRRRESPAVGWNTFYEFIRHVPILHRLGYGREVTWHLEENTTRVDQAGNIVTLGGLSERSNNGFSLTEKPLQHHDRLGWRYLNTTLKNALKVLIGFIPAFLAFRLNNNWWVLAYFGAVIWFGITGLRNILQSVVGGAGLFKSSQLRWNDLVSWERVTDSLLYTGFSVPLLDWLVKSVIMDRWLGVNTSTSPTLLYSVMALVNGTYLAAHNRFRGLPRGAVVGNFFRSIFSIPIAIAFNIIILGLAEASGMPRELANQALQKWAAVIGKAASDLVAGLIEGTADRATNLRTRHADYKVKMMQVLDIHGRLEMLFPESNVLEMLESPKQFMKTVEKEARELEKSLIINSLDLMYFWVYQPRAPLAFKQLLALAQPEERQIILHSQRILERERPISEMFLDNMVGKKFAHSLAFYLDKWPSYLMAMKKLDTGIEARPGPGSGITFLQSGETDHRSTADDTGQFLLVHR